MTPELPYLLDVNVLIALSWPQHVHHERAHAWFASGARHNWATTPMTEAGFVRISTNSSLIPGAVTVAAAVAAIAEMGANPGHRFLADDGSLADPAIDIARMVTSKQVTDVHLVNLAARRGAVLATLDVAIPSYLSQDERHHVLVLPLHSPHCQSRLRALRGLCPDVAFVPTGGIARDEVGRWLAAGALAGSGRARPALASLSFLIEAWRD